VTDAYLHAATVRALVAGDFATLDPAHDVAHLDRVWRLAAAIGKIEGADLEILAAASYLHDYHRVVEYRQGQDHPVAPGECEDLILEVLRQTPLTGDQHHEVLECIRATDAYSFAAGGRHRPASLEGAVLSDADNLDALGAIGLARAFTYGARLGEPIWNPDLPASTCYEPGRTSSIIHHLEEKLIRLRTDMQTPTGRRLAADRHDFVVLFLETFRREWLVEPLVGSRLRSRAQLGRSRGGPDLVELIADPDSPT
jgi:uncharacterized protein